MPQASAHEGDEIRNSASGSEVAPYSRFWKRIRLPLLALALVGVSFTAGMHGVAAWLEKSPRWVAAWLERGLDRPLRIDRLEAVWTGFDLLIRLQGVALLEANRSRPLMSFRRLSVDLAVWRSLWALEPRIAAVRAEGALLGIRRHADRRVVISGLEQIVRKNGDENGAAMLPPQWLQGLPNVVLRDCQVVWFDDKRRAGLPPLYFRDVRLALRNEAGRHRLDVRVALPEGFGEALQVRAEFRGDLFEGDWSGSGHVTSTGLDLPAWFRQRRFFGLQYRQGRVDLEARVVWEKGEPVSAQGDFALKDLHVAPRTGSAADPKTFHTELRGVDGVFRWRTDASGWRLDLPEVRVRERQGEWSSHLNLKVATVTEDRATKNRNETAASVGSEMRLETGPLRGGGLIALARASDWLPQAAYEALSDLNPQVRVNDLRLKARGEDWTDFLLDAHFERLTTRPWQSLPGLKGVSGQLRASRRDGRLRLDGQDLRLDFDGLFPEPLEVTALQGEVLWRRVGDDWRIQTRGPLKLHNADIALQAGLSGALTADGRMEMDLRVRFRDASAVAVPGYVPAPVMTRAAARWLSRAFKGGRAQGGVLLRGDPGNFSFADGPFVGGERRFEARFDAEDVRLDYWRAWPELTGVRAHTAFIDQGMRITIDQGNVYSGDLEHVEVRIPDLSHSVLTVHGKVRAPAAEMQRFVYESPLDQAIGKGLRRLKMRGGTGLDLRIVLPFDTLETEVQGRLRFRGGRVSLLEPRFDFTGVTGEVRFDREALWAEGVRARLRGRDVVVDLGRGSLPGKRPALRVDVEGRMDVRSAVGAETPVLESLVRGEPLWKTRVLVEERAPKGRGNEVRVHVTSDLQGAEIVLPAPLYKPKNALIPFRLDMEVLDEKLAPLRFSLGRDVQGVLALVPDAEGESMVLDRGEIRYRQGEARLPEKPGLVLRGRVKETALKDWLGLIERIPGRAGNEGSGLGRVHVRVDTLNAYGHVVRDLRLEAKPEEEAWRLDIAGEQVRGRILTPLEPDAQRPLQIDLAHLHLEEGEAVTDHSRHASDPRGFPPTRVHVEDFRFGDQPLGQLALDVLPNENGLEVRSLGLISADSDLRAQGDWFFDGQRHRSAFEIEMRSQDLEATLKHWGMGASVDAGKANGRLSAHWEAAPMDFQWPALRGSMNLQVGPGRLLEVEPGMARLLGLLSIPGLSRRVQGDFSDLTAGGLAFDRIEGDFRFDQGKANTQNLVVGGPAAKIEVQGDLDLAREQYDLDLFVTPKISSTLPVATTLLGGTGAGAVVLLAQQVVGDQLDKIARRKFRVTGPWSDPFVDGLTAAQRQAKDAAEVEARALEDNDDGFFKH